MFFSKKGACPICIGLIAWLIVLGCVQLLMGGMEPYIPLGIDVAGGVIIGIVLRQYTCNFMLVAWGALALCGFTLVPINLM